MKYRQSEFEKAKKLFPRGTRVETLRTNSLWVRVDDTSPGNASGSIYLRPGYRGTVESFTKDRIAIRWDLDGELYQLRFKSGWLGTNGLFTLYDYFIKPVSPLDLLAEEPGYSKRLTRHKRRARRAKR